MIEHLFIALLDIGDSRLGGGDSHTDRLNCSYTVFVLLLFALLVTTRQLAGDPISCWCPAEFPDSQVEFTNQVCWVQNTYYLPYDKDIPGKDEPRDWIGYYQWVGLLLCLQAMCFYIPRMIWRVFNRKSGISVCTITDAAIRCQLQQDADDRDKTVRYMVKHMGKFLHETSRQLMMSGMCKSIYWIVYGNYLCFLYLIVKVIYIANAVGQIFLLDRFLGTSYSMYGFEILDKLYQGHGISVSHRFPRVAMCDITIRHLAVANQYTIQCALAVNLFNEKIFIFIWFWFIFVSAATVCSFLIWCHLFIFLGQQERYVRSRLIAMDKMGKHPEHMVQSFLDIYLRRDGIFIIKMVARNASDLIAAELIGGLWEHFHDNKTSVMRLDRRPTLRSERIAAIAGQCFDEDEEDEQKDGACI